ncbi:MAG TPA: T9SS type A sorting domain-containing protein [Bacteroidia bacterium]|jgi:OOP family OmpA-OmpF porin|nr:T9SS type A sorting domain-containing protein [Bacteroidia bacterium]
MKKILFVYISLLFSCSIYAQNLVPNYSFEDTLKCINGQQEFVGYVADWGGGTTSLCYCTAQCGWTGNYMSVPYNYAGFQYAHTGVSYALIYTWASDTASKITGYYQEMHNYRNYIQAALITPLVSATRYYVTFYVNLADSMWYACNDIGAYFSDSSLVYGSSITYAKSYLTPQVANDPIKNKLTDTINWMKVSGSFKAAGGEKYIIIGNFKDDSNSNVEITSSNRSITGSGAYYYIDDIIVSPDSNYADSLAAVGELKIKNYELKVYPNPSSGKFTIESSVVSRQLSVEIYNELGQKVASTPLNLPQGRDFEIDLTSQPSGIYFYRVTTEYGTLLGSGKIMKE